MLPSPNAKSNLSGLTFACINQMPNHPQKATEIGRQARIFKKAKQVIVWLNGTTAQDLEKRIDGLIKAAANAEQHLTKTVATDKQWSTIPGSKSKTSMVKVEQWLGSVLNQTTSKLRQYWKSLRVNPPSSLLQGDEEWLISALENLAPLIQDRWFSSLWTLQEAFLSQWAYIISKELEALHVESPLLRSIFEACETLHGVCKASVAHKTALNLPTANMEVQLIDMIENCGLAALAIENPMTLYTISSQRETSRLVDRVYGIMQAFDFQLGISSPHADPGAAPDLQQPELQLGRELITRYPIMSQLHVHTRPVEKGQAWRVSNASRVPALASTVGYFVTSSFLGDHETLCQFLPTDVDDKPCASFTGRMCYFEVLKQTWSSVDRRRFSDDNGDRFSIGLILVQKSNADVWSRLGICIWDISPLTSSRRTSQQRHLLEGDSND